MSINEQYVDMKVGDRIIIDGSGFYFSVLLLNDDGSFWDTPRMSFRGFQLGISDSDYDAGVAIHVGEPALPGVAASWGYFSNNYDPPISPKSAMIILKKPGIYSLSIDHPLWGVRRLFVKLRVTYP
ncbi:hypothetical protein B9Z35_03430 [Limnohabitans sp. Jir61]|nr:hypothetical protein B9Z35_03430 [Limnohabitans sp. Jir61]